jgi:hypothetical protein
MSAPERRISILAKQPSKPSAAKAAGAAFPQRMMNDFSLHSLQEAFEAKKRYAASEA